MARRVMLKRRSGTPLMPFALLDDPTQLHVKAEACRLLADTAEDAQRKALWIERAHQPKPGSSRMWSIEQSSSPRRRPWSSDGSGGHVAGNSRRPAAQGVPLNECHARNGAVAVC